ncbi:MAG: ATP-binding cassette domain-containing protein, partial [Acidobacteriota bacterium]|nr:ATP-binding cassette domain-containing protein [Acidobacteriota bacterium]
MALIDIMNVRVAYGKPPKTVLDGISLQFQEGEFVCLLGQTGCGKSTLLRLLLGSEQPSQGHIL